VKASIPDMVQDSGVPFDLFIQSLTEQLDKAQAAMALKAKVGKLPLTFAVKDIKLDLKAFVQLIDDEVYLRPAGPGDTEASTISLALTTITKPMIEENAIDFEAEEPKISLREALGDDKESEELQRRLEKIGVRNIKQLAELRRTAGTNVIARLARLPQNRLQRMLKIADAPRVSKVGGNSVASKPQPTQQLPERLRIHSPLINKNKMPKVLALGQEVPVLELNDGEMLLAPSTNQLGSEAVLELDEGRRLQVTLMDGAVGSASTHSHYFGE